ncbi:MAG: hypothetical protein BRD55_10320 [Bacteroidetes bacterium SW_9_63_38]|nr:MAG: hypothetical protein BRD55_10320 [Bacteroidetes bacterium SW_9_63_38]
MPIRIGAGGHELGLLVLTFHRTNLRFFVALAGRETDSQKQGGEDQKALHDQNEIGKGLQE